MSIADKETVLMTFSITDKCSIVVSGSNGIQSVDIPGFKTEELNRLLFEPDERGFITGGWVGDYQSYLNASSIYRQVYNTYNIIEQNKVTFEIENQLLEEYKNREYYFQAWQKTLNNVLFNIDIKLLYPLLEKLPGQIKRLIILPSGGLFLLPLHVVPLSDGQPLCQRYCVSYAPSIQLLREMQNKAEIIEGKGFYAVINHGEDPALVFSGCEGQTISKLFSFSQMDIGEFGTKATVLDKIPKWTYLHFSCHGRYNWIDPPHSGLYLFGGRLLSLADLQNNVVDMSLAWLVTLSACEIGITDVMIGSADEFVGLPAGFMLAGVPWVISSLWSVLDISTTILMQRFYSNHVVSAE